MTEIGRVNAHKTTHQDGGSDEIDCMGLTGRCNFVDRGDPAAYDFEVGVLTTDGVWRDLDVSGVVPSGAIAVQFFLQVVIAGPGYTAKIRKKGNTNTYNALTVTTIYANQTSGVIGIVPVGTSPGFQYWCENGIWSAVNILIQGWFI